MLHMGNMEVKQRIMIKPPINSIFHIPLKVASLAFFTFVPAEF